MQPTQDLSGLALARQIDDFCDRFEEQWVKGPRPRIEDYLASLPAPLRSQLLLVLLPVELELLAREGPVPSETDCRGRFPDHESVIRQVFARRPVDRSASKETSISRASVRSPQAAARPAEAVPKTLGRFAVKKMLGEGALGLCEFLCQERELSIFPQLPS